MIRSLTAKHFFEAAALKVFGVVGFRGWLWKLREFRASKCLRAASSSTHDPTWATEHRDKYGEFWDVNTVLILEGVRFWVAEV